MFRTAMLFLCIMMLRDAQAQYKKYSFMQPEMGSPFTIVLYSTDSLKANDAASSIFRMVDTLNWIYSDYLPGSELNLLCAQAGTGKWIPVSETLFSILTKAYQASRASRGRFDITLSPVIRLWRTARRGKRLPDPDSLAAALRLTGYKLMQLDPVHRTVRLQKRGMQLDLGGIAKGDVAQKAAARLREQAFPFSLIDAGGDIMAGDVPPGVLGWHVAINLPETESLMDRQLLLRNTAVTTSGDLYQYLEVNGIRYSHIIDPLTGRALTNARNVTVISRNGANADWLTKACSIMPVNEALQLIKRFPSTEVQIGMIENNRLRFYRSPGFEAYFSNTRASHR